jgi:hypothetical protein
VCPLGSHGPEVATVVWRAPRDELLLNWPERLDLESDTSHETLLMASNWGIGLPADGAWLSVCEMPSEGRRLSQLARTEGDGHRVVICTARLRPGHDCGHARLLTNALSFAVDGMPRVAVLGPRQEVGWQIVARQVSLQSKAVAEVSYDAPSDLDFDKWPLRSVRQAIFVPSLNGRTLPDVTAGQSQWLASGGQIITLDAGGGFTVRHGVTDERYIASRWAVWFHGCAPGSWFGGY